MLHMQGEDDAFQTIYSTFLDTIVMTTGEFDFNDNFIEREVFYPFLYYFFIVFLVIMAVLFNNLLVSCNDISIWVLTMTDLSYYRLVWQLVISVQSCKKLNSQNLHCR